MSNINIAIDTEAKTVMVTIDGQSVADVVETMSYIYRNSDGEVGGMDVVINTSATSENGVQKRITYYAMGSENAKKIQKTSAKVYNDIAGFIGVDDISKAIADIDEFFSSQRR